MRIREIWSRWTPQVKGRDFEKQIESRGIPILDIDLEYGHLAGAQVRIRAEAFVRRDAGKPGQLGTQ